MFSTHLATCWQSVGKSSRRVVADRVLIEPVPLLINKMQLKESMAVTPVTTGTAIVAFGLRG
jgi:hypothetical protein